MSETEFEAPARLDAGRVVLDEATGRVTVDGEVVPLRGKPFRLLRELMRRPGELVTKAQLTESVWDGRPHSDSVITTTIKEIRQALGDTPSHPWAVETAHGRGYRFLPPVTVLPASAEADAAPGRRPAIVWLGVATVVALALVVAVAFRPEAGEPLRSVGVLPFDDMTVDSDHRWFAEGLTEELLNELMQIPGLDVAARNSAARFRNSGRSVPEIGEALGVSHVIEGSIRNSADGEIRLTVQLIRTADGFHEWSETWDRDLSISSALDIQRDISERVVDLMQGQAALPVDAAGTAALPDEAWQSLLKGRELIERRNADSINAGLGLLRETVALAPDLPQGHAALASAYLFAGDAMQLPPEQSLALARQHANQALELSPGSVEALVALSLVAMANGDPASSLEYAGRALDIAPGYSQAQLRRGVALSNLGRLEDAYQALGRARQLDPLSPIILGNFAQAALNTGRIDEALEAAEDNVRWNGENYVALVQLGRIRMGLGHYEQALACLRASLDASSRHPLVARSLGELYWRIGTDGRAGNVAAGEPGWAPRAAVLVSAKQPQRAIEGSGPVRRYGVTGLTPLDIYYWAGEREAAADWAEQFLESIGDVEALASARVLPDDMATAFLALQAAGREQAEALGSILEQRFEGATAKDERLFANLLVAAQWSAWKADRKGTLASLSRMAELGMVAREVDIDPVFAWLQSDPRFRDLRTQMANRASGLRVALRDSPADDAVCGAG